MIKIEIYYGKEILDTVSVNENTSMLELLPNYRSKLTYPVYACKVDNMYRALNHKLNHDSKVELLDIKNQATWLIYKIV